MFDERGSVVERLDRSGTVLSRHAYTAYGREWTPRDPDDALQASDPWGFGAQSGYYTDPETQGLQQHSEWNEKTSRTSCMTRENVSCL